MRAISTEQGIAAILAGHEDVDMSVVIEVAKRGVTAAAPEPQGIGEERKRPIQIVAVGAECAAAHQQQIEVSVVIEIDKQRVPRAGDVADPGLPCHVFEPAAILALDVVQQVSAPIRADCKNVEPTVVVVVGECGEHGARGQRQRHSGAHVGKEAALHRVQRHHRLLVPVCPRQQQVLATLLVVVAPRERRRWDAEVRQAAFTADVGEASLAGIGSRRDAPHGDERLRIERDEWPAGEWSFDPIHPRERRLIRRADFHESQEAVELDARLLQVAGAQRLQRGVEKRLGLAGRFRTLATNILEILYGAVLLPEPQKHVGQLEMHGKICR